MHYTGYTGFTENMDAFVFRGRGGAAALACFGTGFEHLYPLESNTSRVFIAFESAPAPIAQSEPAHLRELLQRLREIESYAAPDFDPIVFEVIAAAAQDFKPLKVEWQSIRKVVGESFYKKVVNRAVNAEKTFLLKGIPDVEMNQLEEWIRAFLATTLPAKSLRVTNTYIDELIQGALVNPSDEDRGSNLPAPEDFFRVTEAQRQQAMKSQTELQRRRRETLLADKTLWLSAKDVAKTMGSDETYASQSTANLRTRRQILGVWSPAIRGYVYPAFQFDPETGRVRKEMLELLKKVPAEKHDWPLLFWLTSPHPVLGSLSPREWMESGRNSAGLIQAADDFLPERSTPNLQSAAG